MTQKQFLEKLQTLKDWYKTPANAPGRRRGGDGMEECPISELYGQNYRTGQLPRLSDDIAIASDREER